MSDDTRFPPEPSQQRREYPKLARFRPTYRELTPDEIDLVTRIKTKAEELAKLYDGVFAGRCRAEALTQLESSVMWIVKEITT